MLSIIVPIFNSEKVITNCLKSLMNQTLNNFEIILIDDCSSDNSVQIVKQFLKDYPHRLNNLKFIELNRNQGVMNARSIGINESTGKYITFLDSDDYLESNALENMMYDITKNNADIVCYDFFYKKGSEIKYIHQKSINSPQSFTSALFFNKIHGSLCSKIYKKEILLKINLVLDDISIQEDLLLNIQASLFSTKVISMNNAYLYYVFHPKSATNNPIKIKKNIDDMLKSLDYMNLLLKNNNMYNKFIISFYFRKILTYIVILKKLFPYYLHYLLKNQYSDKGDYK